MQLAVVSSTVWGSMFIKENMSIRESRNSAGLGVYMGKLGGKGVALIEQEADAADLDVSLFADIKADYIVSIGEAYSCKKNLETADMVISSAASCLNPLSETKISEVPVEPRMIDLALKAAEKFNFDEHMCKVVVGKVFLNPGTAITGRKLNFFPKDDIYCIDRNGYPLTYWAVERQVPFVLVRTIVPVMDKYGKLEVTQFRWDTAKKNFWIVKGLLDGLKKRQTKQKTAEVDLI